MQCFATLYEGRGIPGANSPGATWFYGELLLNIGRTCFHWNLLLMNMIQSLLNRYFYLCTEDGRWSMKECFKQKTTPKGGVVFLLVSA